MFDSFATPWTIAFQAPLSMGFPKQEYCSELPFPSPEDLPDAGMEPGSLKSPELAGGVFCLFVLSLEPPGKPTAGDGQGSLVCCSP